MAYHLPVLPPDLAVEDGWKPKETFSPSQMTTYGTADGCKRKWAWGSCFGVWGTKKSAAQLLGSLIHGSLEHYLNGGTVYDLLAPEARPEQPLLERLRIDDRTLKEFRNVEPAKLAELVVEAPKRALAGLHLLPNTKDPAVEKIEVERWISIDTRRIVGGIQPIKIPGKIDLSIRRAGVWYLYDHKSTKGRPKDPWCYIKTPEQLLADPQAIFYALDVMLRHNLQVLWIRWVYYLTDTKAHPLAKEVDLELRLEQVWEAAYKWLCVANEMREWVRKALRGELNPYDVPANPEACDGFGGCSYSYAKGGPCMPDGEVKLGNIVISGSEPEKEKGKHQMNAPAPSALAAQLAAVQAQLPNAQPPMVPAMPLVPPEAHGAVPTAAAIAAPPAVPTQPAPPAGWHFGPNGQLRPDAPAGYQYSADGTQFIPLAPPAPPPLPAAAAPAPTPSPAPAAEAVPVPPQTEAPKRGKGRPPGAKNKPKEAGAGGAADEEASAYDVLVSAALAAPEGSPLQTLTVAQLRAVASVLDAA